MVMRSPKAMFVVLSEYYGRRKSLVHIAILLPVLLLVYLKPQQFVALWLTPDQQGQILFRMGDYENAADRFHDMRWRAYSLYGAEQFDQAATLYGQFDKLPERLARANAGGNSS